MEPMTKPRLVMHCFCFYDWTPNRGARIVDEM